MNVEERIPEAGTHLVTPETEIDPRLLSEELAPKNQPTETESALEVAVLWGDTVVAETQAAHSRPIYVGTRKGSQAKNDLEVDGALGDQPSFVIAVNKKDHAEIKVLSGAKVLLRQADGKVVTPSLSGDNTYHLNRGERLVYKWGTLTVVSQYVRGNIKGTRTRGIDWFFPRVFALSALLHIFFVVATFIRQDTEGNLGDDLFKNQDIFAQMILKAPEEEAPVKKLDLSALKENTREEVAVKPQLETRQQTTPTKTAAPRVDARSRERDRKVAMNSGLLGILKGAEGSGAVSNVFGPGGLGTGINNAMGGLRGDTAGDAGGAGGLGSRGTGAGGGGSLGIGGLGTHGHGRGGGGGYGNINLGGRGKARTRVVPGRTIIKGALSKTEIGRVIRRNLARFKYCYEKQLSSNPNLAGKISVYFTIAPTGAVAQTQVRESSMNNATVENCVQGIMKSLKFPAPKGGGIVVVTYPFVFAAT